MTRTVNKSKYKIYSDVTPERFAVLRGRFDQFIFNLDKDVPVIRVYDDLSKEQMDQLAVIREVSQVLQQKKEEDILKAKQAAEEASKAAAEAEAEKKEQAEKAEGKEGEESTKEEDENITNGEKKETVAALYSQ